MPTPANLVHETTSGEGTGTLTLSAVNGKQRFSEAFATGGANTFDYFISSQAGAEWERGTGSISAAGVLTRDTVIESSNSDLVVNFSSGVKDVTNDVPALKQVVTDLAQTLTNKTIDLAGNTLTGTKALFDTALSNDNFAFVGTSNTFTAAQIFPAGAVGTPSVTTTGDTDTGIYFPALNQVGIAAGAVLTAWFTATGTFLDTPSTADVLSLRRTDTPHTWAFDLANNNLNIKDVTSVSTNVVITGGSTGGIQLLNGAAATPTLTAQADTNTGIFWPAADTLAISNGGTETLRTTSANVLLIGNTSTPRASRLELLDNTAATGPNTNGDAPGVFLVTGANRTLADSQAQMALQSNSTAAADFGGMLSLGGRWNSALDAGATFATIAGRLVADAALGGFCVIHTRSNSSGMIETVRFDQRNTAANPALSGMGDTNTGIFWPTADTLAISTGGTERMRSDTTGVGIGRTSSGGQLEVGNGGNDTFAFRVYGASATAFLSYGIFNTTGYVTSGSSGTDSTTLIFRTADTGTENEWLTIDTSGALLAHRTGSAALPTIGKNDDTNTGIFFPAADTLAITTGGTERMRIFSTGRVGIGTTSAVGQLVVDQNSASAAIPTLILEQRDVSEEFIEFDTTIGTGNATEAVGAKTLTETHFIKVTLTGVGTRYIPVGTIA